MDLGLIFITGLTTGALSCMAVQGGLLTSLIAQRAEEDLENKSIRTHSAIPILLFLIAKLTSHVLLGLGLGFLGSRLQLSIEARVVLSIAVGLFMVVSALRILDVHPIFRYLTIQPPKFVYRLIRNQSRSKDYFAPAFLGFMTVFIPCGTTQAMEVLAITSGNPLVGAAIMGTFVLGTSPLFFILGMLATKLSDIFHKYFLVVAAVLVSILGLLSIQNGLSLAGHPLSFNFIEISTPEEKNPAAVDQNNNVTVKDGVQEVTINVAPRVYSPALSYVKSTLPIKLNMVAGSGYACTNNLVIPSLRKQFFLKANTETQIDLGTQPPGKIFFICGMGMYSGNIIVQ